MNKKFLFALLGASLLILVLSANNSLTGGNNFFAALRGRSKITCIKVGPNSDPYTPGIVYRFEGAQSLGQLAGIKWTGRGGGPYTARQGYRVVTLWIHEDRAYDFPQQNRVQESEINRNQITYNAVNFEAKCGRSGTVTEAISQHQNHTAEQGKVTLPPDVELPDPQDLDPGHPPGSGVPTNTPSAGFVKPI